MKRVECSVCGKEIGRGPDGLGIKRHSAMHRREFRELVGRQPEDYAEVREFFQNEGRQPTLREAMLTDEQLALAKFGRLH
jgi:hypothetical protein